MLDKNIKTSTNDKFKFDFTFRVNNIMKKDNNNCIYCKNKNEEMKKKIIDKDKRIKELEDYINEFISFSVKYDINNINELKTFIINKTELINDELLYIDFDIFQWESNYVFQKNNIHYEKYLDILDNIFEKYNINSLSELDSILSNISINKYNNIFNILENATIKLHSQNTKMDELKCKYNDLDNRIKEVKNKINKLPIGTVIKFNGVKKILKKKIEKPIDKIKRMEKYFEEYCQQQIKWARGILDTKYSDDEIIKLIDIYNKIKNDIVKDSSGSECELDTIVNKYNMKTKKIEEYKFLVELGNSFINNNINDKSQIKNFIKNNKEIIYSYDSKDKINRFISTCKRLYYLNQKVDVYNIVKSKCTTAIRDMNNQDFNNLLLLLDKNDN